MFRIFFAFDLTRYIAELAKESNSLGELAIVMFTKRYEPIIQEMPYFTGKFPQPKYRGFFKLGASAAPSLHVSNEVQDFFIPDIEVLFVFLSILKATGIECCLFNCVSNTSQVIHTTVATDKIYGKEKGLLSVGTLAPTFDPAITFSTPYDPKNNYAEHLLKMVKDALKINESIIASFKNPKMRDLAYNFFYPRSSKENNMSVLSILKELTENQFPENFCDFSVAEKDLRRGCYFDNFILNGQEIFKGINKYNVAEVVSVIKYNLCSVKWIKDDDQKYNFFTAFLLFSVSQESLLTLSVASNFLIEQLFKQVPGTSSQLKNKVVVCFSECPDTLSFKMIFDFFKSEKWGGDINFSFDYVVDFTQRKISTKNVRVEMNGLAQKLAEIKEDTLLEKMSLFKTMQGEAQSNEVHWRKINTVADFINKGNISIEVFRRLAILGEYNTLKKFVNHVYYLGVNVFRDTRVELQCEMLLKDRIKYQFNANFSSYEKMLGDIERSFFTEISFNGKIIFINQQDSRPVRIEHPVLDMSMQAIMSNRDSISDISQRILFLTPSFYSANFDRNFIAALLILNMNQGSPGDFITGFQGMLFAKAMLATCEKLGFESFLDVKTFQEIPKIISIVLRTKIFPVSINHMDGSEKRSAEMGFFNISFEYHIDNISQRITVENQNIEMSPAVKALVKKCSSFDFAGLSGTEKNDFSNPSHWRNIEYVAALIRKNRLTLDEIKKLSEANSFVTTRRYSSLKRQALVSGDRPPHGFFASKAGDHL